MTSQRGGMTWLTMARLAWIGIALLVLILLVAFLRSLLVEPDGAPATQPQTTIRDVMGNLDAYVGQTVQVQGLIDRRVSPELFTIRSDDASAEVWVAVQGADSAGGPVLIEGDAVQVTGEVHLIDPDEDDAPRDILLAEVDRVEVDGREGVPTILAESVVHLSPASSPGEQAQ